MTFFSNVCGKELFSQKPITFKIIVCSVITKVFDNNFWKICLFSKKLLFELV